MGYVFRYDRRLPDWVCGRGVRRRMVGGTWMGPAILDGRRSDACGGIFHIPDWRPMAGLLCRRQRRASARNVPVHPGRYREARYCRVGVAINVESRRTADSTVQLDLSSCAVVARPQGRRLGSSYSAMYNHGWNCAWPGSTVRSSFNVNRAYAKVESDFDLVT